MGHCPLARASSYVAGPTLPARTCTRCLSSTLEPGATPTSLGPHPRRVPAHTDGHIPKDTPASTTSVASWMSARCPST
eukprot:364290-Chlamydomonas_euryale.AAC.5